MTCHFQQIKIKCTYIARRLIFFNESYWNKRFKQNNHGDNNLNAILYSILANLKLLSSIYTFQYFQKMITFVISIISINYDLSYGKIKNDNEWSLKSITICWVVNLIIISSYFKLRIENNDMRMLKIFNTSTVKPFI